MAAPGRSSTQSIVVKSQANSNGLIFTIMFKKQNLIRGLSTWSTFLMKTLFAYCLAFLFAVGPVALSGCGSSERASTDPADEMPAEEDLTEDPVSVDPGA